jgi:hypothetical protein
MNGDQYKGCLSIKLNFAQKQYLALSPTLFEVLAELICASLENHIDAIRYFAYYSNAPLFI